MSTHHQSQPAVQNRARTACQSCRQKRSRCIGGPPCENCVQLKKENCEFAYTPPGKKLVELATRSGSNACLLCRTEKTFCNGGPPCENCVAEGREVCTFDLKTHKDSKKKSSGACLPCRLRKICCTGGGAPCGTCTSRGVESTCEFSETTKDDPEEIGIHTTQSLSSESGEPPRNAVMKADTIQPPESILEERPKNRSPNTDTTLDTGLVCRNKSLGCSELLSTISNGNPLSDLAKSPSLVGSDSGNGAHPTLTGCSSKGELLGVLPNRLMIDYLIERYFESISKVKLVYQKFGA